MSPAYLQHAVTAYPSGDKFRCVTGCSWAPDGSRFACPVVEGNGSVYINIFDSQGKRQDKFACKPKNEGGSFMVTGLAYSADSERLAVAQSDGLLAVYRMGKQFQAKKSVSRKFGPPSGSPITSLVWPAGEVIVFGCADGALYTGDCAANKTSVLCEAQHGAVLSVSCSSGTVIASYSDGVILRANLLSGRSSTLTKLDQAPLTAMHCNTHVAAITLDGVAHMIPLSDTAVPQDLSLTLDTDGKQDMISPTCAAVSATGRLVAVGGHNCISILRYSAVDGVWSTSSQSVADMTPTSMDWATSETRLVVTTAFAAVEMLDLCLKRVVVGNTYELTQLSPSQLLIRELSASDSQAFLLRSADDGEIARFRVRQGRYVIARTPSSLLLADLRAAALSEVPWAGRSDEVVTFQDDIVLVHSAGELTVVQLGQSSAFQPIPSNTANPSLVSVSVSEAMALAAVLTDPHTLRVFDLHNGAELFSHTFNRNVEWIGLSASATALLVRNADNAAVLVRAYQGDWVNANVIELLPRVSFINWVPRADVAVAQSGSELYTWYSLAGPGSSLPPATVTPIEGTVVRIRREKGTTTVDADGPVPGYELDEPLIGFSAAIDSGDAASAAAALEGLALSPEVTNMWRRVALSAADNGSLPVAALAAGVSGSIATQAFLSAQQPGNTGISDAARAIMVGDLDAAEQALIRAGRGDDAIDLLVSMQAWTMALDCAKRLRSPKLADLMTKYEQWLTQTQQYDLIGELREADDKLIEAVDLYIKGAAPERAAAIIIRNVSAFDPEVVKRVTAALTHNRLFGRAGQLFEALRVPDRAIQCYIEDEDYLSAKRVARNACPDRMAEIECSQAEAALRTGRPAEAVRLFYSGQNFDRAVDVAINNGLWAEAVKIIPQLPKETAHEPACRAATHFAAIGRHSDAEKLYLYVGAGAEAVQMYATAGLPAEARRVANKIFDKSRAQDLLNRLGQRAEASRNTNLAEGLYCAADNWDAAVLAYENCGQLNDALRVARSAYQRTGNEDKYHETLNRLARAFEKQGLLRRAEAVWCDAGDWREAVHAYVNQQQYPEAIRVAERFGGSDSLVLRQTVLQWANVDVQAVISAGLVELSVHAACDARDFEAAVRLCHQCDAPHLLQVVLSRQAQAAEQEGDYQVAIDTLVAGDRSIDAVRLALRAHMYDEARRVASEHCPDMLTEIDKARENDSFEAPRAQPQKAPVRQEEEEYEESSSEGLFRSEAQQARSPERPRAPQPPVPAPQPVDSDAQIDKAALGNAVQQLKRRNIIGAVESVKAAGSYTAPQVVAVAAKIGQLALMMRTECQMADTVGGVEDLTAASDLLHLVAEALTSNGKNVPSSLSMLRFATHIAKMRGLLWQLGLKDLALRAAIALCRYVDFVPLVHAMLCAGLGCMSDAGGKMAGTAFVLLNGAVDIADEELNDAPFAGTDIDISRATKWSGVAPPPQDLLERAREWLLNSSVEYPADQLKLPQTNCPKCGHQCYAASLRCPSCSAVFVAGAITGWPVRGASSTCSGCGSKSDTESWAAYVRITRRCPCCGVHADLS